MVIGSLLSNQLEPENAAHRKQKVAAIAKKKHVVKHKQKTAATHNKKMATIQKQMDVKMEWQTYLLPPPTEAKRQIYRDVALMDCHCGAQAQYRFHQLLFQRQLQERI